MSPPTTPAPSPDAPKPGTGRRIAPPTPGTVREEPRAVYSLADCMAPSDDDAGDADFVVIYGAPGTGKSSFAAGFPRPWFLRVDPKGTQSLPRSINKSNVPTTWDELPGKRFDPQRPSIMGLLRVILDSETPPGTLVLDTVNKAEALLFEYLCKLGQVDSIEAYDGGYGHGFTKSTEMMHKLIQLLHQINGRGVTIIAVSHAGSIKVPNPSGAQFEQWGMSIVKKSGDLWMGDASTVVFAQSEGQIETKDAGKKSEKSKIRYTGRTLAHVVPGQGWFAKNRDCLPSPMVLDADVFAEEARIGQALKEQYYSLRGGLSPARRAEIGERMAVAGWSRENMLEVIAELTNNNATENKEQAT